MRVAPGAMPGTKEEQESIQLKFLPENQSPDVL
jgi:hypothetical protein